MDTELKVRNLQDGTYQVVEMILSDSDNYKYEDESVLHQGSLADCEAFIRLTENGYM